MRKYSHQLTTIAFGFISFIILCRSVQAEIVFQEDFSTGLTNWVSFGSPAPLVRNSVFGNGQVFDNMGDSSYGSGAYSNSSVDLNNGGSIEADVYLNFSNKTGCWASASLELSQENAPATSSTQVPAGALMWSVSSYGDACYATEGQYRHHSWFSFRVYTESGTWDSVPSYTISADNYTEGWHKAKVNIRTDRLVEFYIDEALLWTSSQKIGSEYLTGKHIVLGSRSSGSAGKAYHDNVIVKNAAPPKPALGDVNNDTVIDLKDLINVLQVLTGNTSYPINILADVGCDGKIGLLDAIMQLKVISGNQPEIVYNCAEYVESDDRYVTSDAIGDNRKSATVYIESESLTGVVLETTTGKYKISATFIEQESQTRIAAIVDDGGMSFTIVFFIPNDFLQTLKDNLRTASTESEREQTLRDFLAIHAFSLNYNSELERLDITIPKDLISTLSGTTYKVSYDGNDIPDNTLFVINDDPVIGWYFNDSTTSDEISYELPQNNDGEVIIFWETVLSNDGNITVSYRETACLSDEVSIFQLGALWDSKINGILSGQLYTVCAKSSLTGLSTGTGTHILTYTAYGKYADIGTDGTDVYLGSQDASYKISVIKKATNPDPTIYSCLGSYDSSNGFFGDCGFTSDIIWIGVIPNSNPAGTVLSEGRMWQQSDDGEFYTWQNAKTYCQDSSLGGYNDWKLPTKDELKTLVYCSDGTTTPLVDIGSGTPNFCADGDISKFDIPTIDSSFSCQGAYWTSTPYNANSAWYVSFFLGESGWNDQIETYHVRCVR